jgi:RNA-directed DNA polymerase
MGGIVEAEVRGDCASIDRAHRREVRRQRVQDGRMLRRIGKWRRAGVRDEGVLPHPETGGVQGGGISPVLANVGLPHVLVDGCEREVRPRMQGRGFLRRCADDVVMGGEGEAEARRIMAGLPKRFARFGLRIPPSTTARMAFKKPETRKGSADGNGTGDCLGLTHDGTRSRPGVWVRKGRTARKR